MRTFEFEPIIIVPFKFEGKTQKHKVKRLSEATIKRIQSELKEQYELKELEDLRKEREELTIRADFLRKKLQYANRVEDIDNIEKEFFELKKKIEEINEKIEEKEKETGDIEDKTLCLATAGDEQTKEFFEKVAERYGWKHLSNVIAEVFREYDKDFLSA